MLPSGAEQGDGCSHDRALEMRLATRIFLQRTSTTCAPNTGIYGCINDHFPASLATAKPRFSIGPFGQCTTVTLAGYILSLHKSHMALADAGLLPFRADTEQFINSRRRHMAHAVYCARNSSVHHR